MTNWPVGGVFIACSAFIFASICSDLQIVLRLRKLNQSLFGSNSLRNSIYVLFKKTEFSHSVTCPIYRFARIQKIESRTILLATLPPVIFGPSSRLLYCKTPFAEYFVIIVLPISSFAATNHINLSSQ